MPGHSRNVVSWLCNSRNRRHAVTAGGLRPVPHRIRGANLQVRGGVGQPGGTRTPYPCLRRTLLYPDELLADSVDSKSAQPLDFCCQASLPCLHPTQGLPNCLKWQQLRTERGGVVREPQWSRMPAVRHSIDPSSRVESWIAGILPRCSPRSPSLCNGVYCVIALWAWAGNIGATAALARHFYWHSAP